MAFKNKSHRMEREKYRRVYQCISEFVRGKRFVGANKIRQKFFSLPHFWKWHMIHGTAGNVCFGDAVKENADCVFEMGKSVGIVITPKDYMEMKIED